MITIFQKPFGFHIKLDKWNADIIADIKAINWQSRKYIEAERVWEVDLSHKAAVDALKIRYGGRFVEQTEEEKIGEIPPMPKLTIDIPTRLPLREYQAEGVAYGMEKLHFINGDAPGLGKSFQTIATIYALNAWPALIICPASLRRNWQLEWEKFVGIKAMILNDSVKKTWPTFYEMGMCKVFIVNYESLKKYFVLDIVKNEKGKFKLSNVKFNSNINIFESVAIDELHKIKDPTTMVSKLVRGVCAKKKVVIGLTGTPIVNKPKDLVAQLLAIGQLEAVAGNYKHFMNRYCGGMAGAGATNLEELNYKLKTTCFFQRLKKDVLKDLPDKVHQIVYCDITTRDEYNKASTDLANYLKENKDKTDAEVAKSMRGEVMVKIGILKQISARGKMNEVSEYIEEIVDADEKVGVFLHHKEIANFVKEKFPSTLLYTGSQSDEEKNKAVHDFQKCKKCDIRFENHVNCDHEHVPSNNKIIALSTKAGGVGLTLTAASRMAVIELPWHPADCEQIESRFHRMSQKNSVQCTYFLGKDTIDEHIYDIIEKKRAIADTVLGVSDDRKFVDDFIKDYNDGKIKL